MSETGIFLVLNNVSRDFYFESIFQRFLNSQIDAIICSFYI